MVLLQWIFTQRHQLFVTGISTKKSQKKGEKDKVLKLSKNSRKTTILVWNELHLRSKDSGIWQSDKIDKHFSKYITLVIFFNYTCSKKSTNTFSRPSAKIDKHLSYYIILVIFSRPSAKIDKHLIHYTTLVIFSRPSA